MDCIYTALCWSLPPLKALYIHKSAFTNHSHSYSTEVETVIQGATCLRWLLTNFQSHTHTYIHWLYHLDMSTAGSGYRTNKLGIRGWPSTSWATRAPTKANVGTSVMNESLYLMSHCLNLCSIIFLLRFWIEVNYWKLLDLSFYWQQWHLILHIKCCWTAIVLFP